MNIFRKVIQSAFKENQVGKGATLTLGQALTPIKYYFGAHNAEAIVSSDLPGAQEFAERWATAAQCNPNGFRTYKSKRLAPNQNGYTKSDRSRSKASMRRLAHERHVEINKPGTKANAHMAELNHWNKGSHTNKAALGIKDSTV